MEQLWEIRRWEKEWLWEGLPVLKCRCALPHFPGNTLSQRRMEGLWRCRERLLLRWLEEYYCRCCRRGEATLCASRPILQDLVTVQATVETEGEGLLSLLLTLETPSRRRCWPELWNILQGVPVDCKTLLSPLQRLRWGHGRLLLTKAGLVHLGRDGERIPVPAHRAGAAGKSGKSRERPCTAERKRV